MDRCLARGNCIWTSILVREDAVTYKMNTGLRHTPLVRMMHGLFLCLLALVPPAARSQTKSSDVIEMPSYRAELVRDEQFPRLLVSSQGHPLYRLPLLSGISSQKGREAFTHITISKFTRAKDGSRRLEVDAESSLLGKRRFEWRFFNEHIEYQHYADANVPINQVFFFSNGLSGFFDNGTSPGIGANTIIDAQQYFAPNPSFTNELKHNIEVPQTLGVRSSPGAPDLGRAANSHLFTPTMLALAFRSGSVWSSIGIGTRPGKYQFNGLEFSGEHYAGASFWVDYQGRTNAAAFSSPVATIQFGQSPSDVLKKYISWMHHEHFTTERAAGNAPWHRLPIFCGWAEQTARSAADASRRAGPAMPSRSYATQANYTEWISELEKRDLPISTIVIDDKWNKTYGGLEVDTQKWPDLAGFVSEQHRKGRHVLLWIPMAQVEGLPFSLTVTINGKAIAADVSNPEYEIYLRQRIHYLVETVGVDGFKEDWINAPRDFSATQQHQDLFGMEWVHRFQWILFDEAHKWKKDALVETQTPNPLYLDSSDVLRLNDIYSGTRDVPTVMAQRAEIAHIAGWPLVDTDNASTTTLAEWWAYMKAQPSIGIPALYFVSETAVTHEKPSAEQWTELAGLWKSYIQGLPANRNQ